MAGADYGEIIFRDGVYQPHADHLGGGIGGVRLYIQKTNVIVWLDGSSLHLEDVDKWTEFFFKHDVDWRIEVLKTDDGIAYQGEIAGCQFQVQPVNGNAVDVELIDPGGAIWQARGGYEVGEGFMDDDDTPEQFYQRLIGRKFHWTEPH